MSRHMSSRLRRLEARASPERRIVVVSKAEDAGLIATQETALVIVTGVPRSTEARKW